MERVAMREKEQQDRYIRYMKSMNETSDRRQHLQERYYYLIWTLLFSEDDGRPKTWEEIKQRGYRHFLHFERQLDEQMLTPEEFRAKW